jgi:hypothetical protein
MYFLQNVNLIIFAFFYVNLEIICIFKVYFLIKIIVMVNIFKPKIFLNDLLLIRKLNYI